MPEYTTTPPNTGTGLRCSFRALGWSTISCLIANLRAKGKTKAEVSIATSVTITDICDKSIEIRYI